MTYLTDDVRQVPAATFELGMLPYRSRYLAVDRLVQSWCDRCVFLISVYTATEDGTEALIAFE